MAWIVKFAVSTGILDIFLGTTFIISALKLSSIALGAGSLSNLILRYLSISPIVGMTVVVTTSAKYLSFSSGM